MSTRTSTPRTRLSPAQRREQLLDLGVRLLSTRSLDELSIDVLAEEAGAIALFGRDETVDLAPRLVRARDTVSVIGVQQSRRYAFPLERFCSGPDVQGWDVLGPRGASHPVPAGAVGTPAA